MGATACKACGSDPQSCGLTGAGLSMDFAPPHKGADGYNPSLPMADPLEWEAEQPGAAASASSGGAPLLGKSTSDGATTAFTLGPAKSTSRDMLTSLTTDSNWVSYFGREEAEIPSLPDPTGAAGRQRRRYRFDTEAVYDGEWLGTERSGFGVQTWPDGAVYQGQWDQHKANGRGKFVHCEGDVYVGEWRDNMAHGRGTYVHKDGTSYSGEFRDDLQDGLGVEKWCDSSTFKGEFCKGRKNGHGVYHWPDGSEYSGQWNNNSIDGCGTYEGSDERTFKGRWRESHMHGCGRYSWPDGKTYKGQYNKDQKDGFGVFEWPGGRCYEGYWALGLQHGLGRIYAAGLDAKLAEWRHGERHRWLDLPEGPSKEKVPGH